MYVLLTGYQQVQRDIVIRLIQVKIKKKNTLKYKTSKKINSDRQPQRYFRKFRKDNKISKQYHRITSVTKTKELNIKIEIKKIVSFMTGELS
jgi:hypothetical protein